MLWGLGLVPVLSDVTNYVAFIHNQLIQLPKPWKTIIPVFLSGKKNLSYQLHGSPFKMLALIHVIYLRLYKGKNQF